MTKLTPKVTTIELPNGVSIGKRLHVVFTHACCFMVSGVVVVDRMCLEFEATFSRNDSGDWVLGTDSFKLGLSSHGTFSDSAKQSLYKKAMVICPEIVRVVGELPNLDLLRKDAHIQHVVGMMEKIDRSYQEVLDQVSKIETARQNIQSKLYAAIRGEIPNTYATD